MQKNHEKDGAKTCVSREELLERLGNLANNLTVEDLELFLLFVERYLAGRK